MSIRESIAKRAARAIEERVFPGCVIGIVRPSGEREIFPIGHLTYERQMPAVTTDAMYDLASITKSIPTASLALNAVNEGNLRLESPIRTYVPELRNDYGATIEDLLRYRVSGVQMSTLKRKKVDEIIAHIFETGFKGPPGETLYTNLPAYLLGVILERIHKMKIDDLATEYFFMPLGMSRTYFIEPFPKNAAAPTEVDDESEVRGAPHDESARALAKLSVAAGHAGLFSTAPDILNFLEALLASRFPHIADGAEQGLGWQVHQAYFMGSRSSPKTFGKTGFTGTSIVIDREREIAFVILSNRTYPKRPPNDDAINEFRRDIADIVFESLQ
ncbi:MAG: Beta-lactamase [Parcubacteria group bacterium GW2011_GWA2_51_10]|nr:MAG: Beta-lactamase [Parcubacteria group bacterium GW2011_GWA2_51_10]